MNTVELHASGFSFAGEPLRLRGIGVGSWLNLEHFMVGLPGLDGMIRQELEARCPGVMPAFEQSMFADEDAAFLRNLGVNFIRVPFAHSLVFDDQTGAFREEGLAALRRLGAICDKYRLFYMPDLHTTPGGQNPDWHSGNRTGIPQFWQYRAFRDQAVMIWQRVAEVLRDSEYLLGYDLLNEPVLPDGDKTLLNEFHTRAAQAIRQVDQRHLLLVEGGRFAMDFSGIELPDPGRSTFTYHFYPTVWEPSLEDPSMAEADRLAGLRRAHDQILASMPRRDLPLLCGETGCELQTLGDDFGLRILGQTVQVFEENGASWCVWSYKDTGMMGLACPGPDTAWQQLARAVARQWTHHQDMQRGDALTRHMAEVCFGQLTPDELYRTQFIMRAMLFPLEAEHVLRPALAALTDAQARELGGDFRLNRCRIRKQYADFLKKYCNEDSINAQSSCSSPK